MTTITVELDEEQAAALAQFCKRVDLGTFQNHAKNNNEANLMQMAVAMIRKELQYVGHDPR